MNTIYQLTEIQKSYLIGRQDVYELGNTSTHGYYEYKTNKDLGRLEVALNKTIKKHNALRTVITDDGMQKILDQVEDYKIPIINMDGEEDSIQKETLQSIRNEMEQKAINIYEWPLFEFKAIQCNNCNYLCVGFDFIIMDASSLNIFWQDVLYYYDHIEEEVPKFEYSFGEYVEKIQNIKETEQYATDMEFWKGQIAGYPEALQLPEKVNVSEIKYPHFTRLEDQIDEESFQRLKKLAKKNKLSVSSILLTAFGLVLSRWSNSKNFPINLTITNRLPFHPEINQIIGNYITTMLYDFDFTDVKDFWLSACYVERRMFECLQHCLVSGIEVGRLIRSAKGNMSRSLSSVVFTCMLQESYAEPGQLLYSASQTPQVYLDCHIIRKKDGIQLSWDYVDELLDNLMMQDMFHQYIESIRNVIECSWDYEEIFAFRKDECKFHKEYNDSLKEIPSLNLVDLFDETVQKYPDKIAIVEGKTKITYRELNERAQNVAAYIQSNDLGKCNIGIIVDRCSQTIINMLGILKAGCSYVPIAPEVPEERVRFIVKKSGCQLLLKGREEYKDSRTLQAVSIEPDDLAYIIFTSGSTGNPKGVQITHDAVCNTILDINSKFSVSSKDNIMGISSMCFDLSVYDIFGAFTVGATLVILHEIRDFDEMYQTFVNENITIWNSVPCIMDNFICEVQRRKLTIPKIQSLRLVMLSGDWIPLYLPERIKKLFDKSKVISLGGATEASIWSIYYEVEKIKEKWTSIPYGYPLANQKMYVLNEELEELPVGVVGEIFIGGRGVAKGYLNEPELTEKSFITTNEYGRIYRTGDYGVLNREDGIEFLGRKDGQVKLFGYRIELNEIETVVLANEKRIERCSAVVNSERLCLFYTSLKPIDADEISQMISKHLPNYMVPQIIMRLDELPVNANNKIDKKILSIMMIKQEQLEDDRPENGIQLELQNIWNKVLGVENIKVNDNFYLLGGDSLKLGQVQYAITENFGISIPFKDMFQAFTIKRQEKILKSYGIR